MGKREALWRVVVDSKFGSSWGEWYSNEPMGGHMGWGYGRILGGVGRSFLVISDLKWERASMFDYAMICGVGI
jgi:hypothetical protein